MRNDLFTRVVFFVEERSHHRYCEDGFYACPKNPEYIGRDVNTPIEKRVCDCGADEAFKLLEDLRNPL